MQDKPNGRMNEEQNSAHAASGQTDGDQLVVGIDVGTTSVKLAVYNLAGECLFLDSVTYATLQGNEAGWVEQDPEAWFVCIQELSAAMSATLGELAKSVACVGVVSQVNTHVFVDAEGKALMNAIVWRDQRCAEAAAVLDGKITAELRSRCWGSEFVPDASFLMSRAQWLSMHEPKLWHRTRWILSPKDYCLMRMTGGVRSDAISSVGLVNADGEYLAEAFELIDGLANKLPPLGKIYDVVGNLDRSIIESGCPAVIATMDAWGSMFGSGAAKHGDAYQVSGTSEILGVVSTQANKVEGVVTFPPFSDWYLHAGPTQLGGEAASWFARFMDRDIEEVLAAAGRAGGQPGALLFLPHLMGERAPLWDSSAKGAFIGLNGNHKFEDMARSVLEGVGHACRWLLESLEQAAGFSVPAIKVSGGAARSNTWCQIKADIMGLPLQKLKNLDTGTLGAALIAAVGAGLYKDLGEAAETAVAVDRVFNPDPAKLDYYKQLHSIYRTSYQQLKPVNSLLGDL